MLCNRRYMTGVPFVKPFQKPSLVFDRLNFNYVFTNVDNREIKGYGVGPHAKGERPSIKLC